MTFHYEPAIELTRGSIVECIHYGAIAAVSSDGTLLASYGDAEIVTFLRSSAKPFQALPFIERGGDQTFGLTEKEVALICASHSGTDEHVSVARGIQAKIGVTEKDLMCGVHSSIDKATANEMLLRGEEPTPNRHNCSGKHTGMLAHARLRNLSIDNYVDINHPVQQTILETFAEMCSLRPDQVVVGIDGCSVPTFAVPLRNAAWAYARLCDPRGLAPNRAAACQRITHAMTHNSLMVGGPGRFDTLVMELARGNILTKGGAEGYQGIGIMPGAIEPGSPAVGLAMKISDGDAGGRAVCCMAIEALYQMGALSKKDVEALKDFGAHPLYNYRHLHVGDLYPSFKLEKPNHPA